MPFTVNSAFILARVILTLFGLVFGLVSFGLLFWNHHNYHAGVWAFISALFAAAGFHISVLQLKRRLHLWYSVSSLSGIEVFGVMNACASLVACGVYISLGIVKNQDFTYDKTSYYPAALFSILSLVWASLLGYLAYRSSAIVEFLSLP